MVNERLIKKRYIAVDISDSISALIGKLKQNNAKTALVLDKNKFEGIADTHRLIRTKINPTEVRVKKIIKHIPTLNGGESLKETIRLMYTGETRILPVIKDKKVIGIVHSKDIIQELAKTKHADKKIKEIMTLEPITIKQDSSVGEAISIMKEKHISRIPVVDEQNNLINIAALTDFMYKFTLRQQSKTERKGRESPAKRTKSFKAQKTDLNKFPVKNIATPILVTASPEDTLERVIEKMERFDISSIVVKEDKKAVGIITTRDFLRLFLEDLITM
ncbi:CBS domain-containing protein [Candidatus Woesearchaeota archaeon]|nr:CBS domain-containing protein [Candidatus Woesearchaeota archaeon]